MALVPDQKFSTFQAGGALQVGDIIVGLREGINTKFNWAVPVAVDTITGTANQVLVNGSGGVPVSGAVTLTTPQDIATTSTPLFNQLKLTGSILDVDGNFLIGLVSAGAASTNYIAALSNTTGLPVILTSFSTIDANVDLHITTKQAGLMGFYTTASVNAFSFNSGTTHQHVSNWVYPNTANTNIVTWQDASGTLAYLSDIPAGSPSAMTKVDDTNVTLTLGGTPATSLLQAVSLTMGWTGTLSPTRGGTGINNGVSTFTIGGNVTFSGAFTFAGTLTGNTAVTFPTSGTLATTSQLVTPAALTKTDDTNVTLTLGGSPSTALVNAASLTLGWTGQLGLTRGGTAASLTASNGGIVYSTASALAILAGTATAGQMLQSGASTTPAWSTSTYPATNAVNTLLYASSANVMAALATANNGILITSAGGVPSISSTLPSGIAATNMNLTTPTLGVATATSINFGGSALSTYVENGTWSPTVTFATPGDVSVVYSIQVGRYTRIGNVVTATFTLAFTPTFTTASGFLRITLPITTNATTNVFAFGTCLCQSPTFPAGTTSLFLQALNNSSFFLIGANGSALAATYMSTTQFTSTVPGNVQGTLVYLV